MSPFAALRGGPRPLRENATGKYRKLAGAAGPPPGTGERLVLVFIPSLVATLRNREMKKGAPLTEEEVLSIRDNGTCIAMRQAMVGDFVDSRGYDDVDPEDVWNAWQTVRAQLDAARKG